MSYSILYHPDVFKEDLPKISKNIKETLKKAIETRLMNEPFLYGEPLRQSLKGYRKLRVSDYRIIYRVEEDKVIILKIGHRKEAYTQVFSRLSD